MDMVKPSLGGAMKGAISLGGVLVIASFSLAFWVGLIAFVWWLL